MWPRSGRNSGSPCAPRRTMASEVSRYRQGQHKQWRGKGGEDGSLLRTDNGHTTHQETEEICAAIAHINARGWKVEPQKTQQRTGHSGAEERHGADPGPHISQQYHQHQADAARQAIHAVNQVDQIGHGHEPKHCDRPSPESQVNNVAGEGKLKLADLDSKPAGGRGDEHLADEFAFGAQRGQVVPQT